MQNARKKITLLELSCILFILVSVGRLPELFGFLSALQLGKVALLLAVVGLFTSAKKYSKSKEPVSILDRYVNIFGMIVMFSILVSVWKSNSLQFFFKNVIPIWVFFFAVTISARDEKVLNLYVNTAIGSLILLLLFSVQYRGHGRIEVIGAYDANDLAAVCIALFPLLIIKLVKNNLIGKIIILAVMLYTIYIILISGSRGAFIALSLQAIFLFFSKQSITDKAVQIRRKLTGKKIILLVVCLTTVLVVTPDDVWKRLSTLLNYEEDYNVTHDSGRFAIWGRGVDHFLSRPYGSGVDAYSAVDGYQGGTFKASHNAYIQTAVELGLAGLIMYILFYVSSFKILRSIYVKIDRNKNIEMKSSDVMYIKLLNPALQASIVGFFVTSIFLSAAYSPVFYFILAMVSAQEKLVKRSIS